MSWFTVSHAQVEGSTIRLRFRPDSFRHDDDAPVTEVTIEGVEHTDQAMAILARIRNDFVVDLTVASPELRLFGDMDDEETIVRGTRVTSRTVAYSNEELRQFAIFFEKQLRDETSLAHRHAAKLKDIQHFVAGLIERVEKKQALSQKSNSATESQLALLKRVLHRINDP